MPSEACCRDPKWESLNEAIMARKSSESSSNKAPPDVFVGLLFVSISALIIGIILLFMELSRYNFQLG